MTVSTARVRRAVTVLAVVLLDTSCGGSSTPAGLTAQPRPVKVSAEQSRLAPDGSVPFVEERAAEQDFQLTPDPPPRIGDSKPCLADQVRAQLDYWTRQGEGEDEAGRRPPPGVYGYVRFTAADPTVRCTLQGQPKIQLLIDDQVVPLRTGDSITAASKKVITLVSKDTSADLRIDWSPPYCSPAGTQKLSIALPHEGGDVAAAVLRPRTPACVGGSSEIGTQLRSYLSPSAFTQHQKSALLNSSLAGMKASMVAAPTHATAGQMLQFKVRLTNPTPTAIPLDPCPGFVLERFILGTGNRTGFNTAQLYRLNCRATLKISAHGSLDFQMQAAVPEDPPGARMSVTWRLIARGLGSGAWCHFDVPLGG